MNLFFFDTETTGLDDEADIIQFCGKFFGKKEKPQTEYFYTNKKIELGAMSTHHITPETIKDKRRFLEYIPELNKIADNHIFVAHNAKFDIGRIKHEGAKEPKLYIDTLKVAQSILQWQDNYPEKYTLQYLRYFLDLKFEQKINPHDAESDVIVLEALFNALFLNKYFLGFDKKEILTKMINISKNPILLRRINFGKYRGDEFKNIDLSYLQWLVSQSKKNINDFSEDLIFTVNAEMHNRTKSILN